MKTCLSTGVFDATPCAFSAGYLIAEGTITKKGEHGVSVIRVSPEGHWHLETWDYKGKMSAAQAAKVISAVYNNGGIKNPALWQYREGPDFRRFFKCQTSAECARPVRSPQRQGPPGTGGYAYAGDYNG